MSIGRDKGSCRKKVGSETIGIFLIRIMDFRIVSIFFFLCWRLSVYDIYVLEY